MEKKTAILVVEEVINAVHAPLHSQGSREPVR